jgi:hypothetical protein
MGRKLNLDGQEPRPKKSIDAWLDELAKTGDVATTFKYMPASVLADLVILAIANHLHFTDNYDKLEARFNQMSHGVKQAAVADYISDVASRSNAFFTRFGELLEEANIDFTRIAEIAEAACEEADKAGTSDQANTT